MARLSRSSCMYICVLGTLWAFVLTSDVDLRHGDDEKVSLTCFRNQYLNKNSRSCEPCSACEFVDLDLHTHSTCDQCTSSANYSNLVYCPARCLSQNEGMPPWLRVIGSLFIMIVVPSLVIPLALVTIIIFIN